MAPTITASVEQLQDRLDRKAREVRNRERKVRNWRTRGRKARDQNR